MDTFEIPIPSKHKSRGSKRTINSSANHFKPLVPKSKDIQRGNKRERVISIINSSGQDVTPINLGLLKKNPDGSMSTVDVSSTASSITDLLNQLESLTSGSSSSSINGSAVAKSSFGGSKMMVSVDKNQSFSRQESNTSQFGLDRSINSSVAVKKDVGTGHVLAGIAVSAPKVANPDKLITLNLLETQTNFMLSIPSVVVSAENEEERVLVKAQNAKYKELLALNRNNDNYISKHAQTYTNPIKNKEISTTGNKSVDCEVNTDSWDIYDEYVVEEEEELTEGQKVSELEAKLVSTQDEMSSTTDIGAGSAHGSRTSSQASNSVAGSVFGYGSKSTIGMSIAPSSNGSAASGMGTSTTNLVKDRMNAVSKPDDLMKKIDQESLMETLSLMERAIVANNFKKKTISFRNVRDCGADEKNRIVKLLKSNDYDMLDTFDRTSKTKEESADEDAYMVPQLKFLWLFKCDLTTGRPVSYISWNKDNEDILAVGYGESKTLSKSSPGLILVWSIRNPEWPDRVYTLSHPVTSLDFSKSNPFLLAAGLTDGRIVICDIRQKKDKIILDAGEGNGVHRDPVWEVQWIERERVLGDEQSRDESLVSVSSDGRVTQWTIRKGLEYSDLMILKRMSKQKSANAQKNNGSSGNSFIARNTGGLCFDFNSKDNSTYVVGTEDGHIHKCSCSYNEQYLNSYSAHSAPVTRVKWSPFVNGVFASCSSDWTSKIWDQDYEQEIFKFQSGKDEICDIAWSPHSATIFGTVSSVGKLEIWDLECSVLDPTIVHSVAEGKLNTINFGSHSPVVLTGDNDGNVNVFKICKGSKKNTASPDGSGTIDDTADGIISPVANLPSHHANHQQWKAAEAKRLLKIIHSRTTTPTQ